MKFKNITKETILVRLEVTGGKVPVEPNAIVEADEACARVLTGAKGSFEVYTESTEKKETKKK